MYFAQNNSLDKFELYLSFLSNIIEKGNDNYEALFHGIFNEVQLLSQKKIDYSEVSSERFDIVSVLAFNHAKYFETIDLNKLTAKEYKEVHDFLLADINHVV